MALRFFQPHPGIQRTVCARFQTGAMAPCARGLSTPTVAKGAPVIVKSCLDIQEFVGILGTRAAGWRGRETQRRDGLLVHNEWSRTEDAQEETCPVSITTQSPIYCSGSMSLGLKNIAWADSAAEDLDSGPAARRPGACPRRLDSSCTANGGERTGGFGRPPSTSNGERKSRTLEWTTQTQ